MPDVFVPVDTAFNTVYFRKLYAKNVLNTFTLEYYDKNRAKLKMDYKTFEDFKNKFQFDPDDIKAFIAKGEAEGVKYDDEQFKISEEEIILILKGLVATNMWKSSEYYEIINVNDNVLEKALKVINDKKSYNTILGFQ